MKTELSSIHWRSFMCVWKLRACSRNCTLNFHRLWDAWKQQWPQLQAFHMVTDWYSTSIYIVSAFIFCFMFSHPIVSMILPAVPPTCGEKQNVDTSKTKLSRLTAPQENGKPLQSFHTLGLCSHHLHHLKRWEVSQWLPTKWLSLWRRAGMNHVMEVTSHVGRGPHIEGCIP